MKSTIFVVLLLCFASLGHALICRGCYSTVSSEDCDENAVEETCQGPKPVCMMYHTTAVKDGEKDERYIRYCTSKWQFEIQQKLCKMEPQENPNLGVVTCRACKEFLHKPSCLIRHALICRGCFSTVSSEDCDENAVEETCQGPNPVCMMYQTTAVKDGEKKERYIRYCTSERLFEIQKNLCKMEPQENPNLGVVTCRACKEFLHKPSCLIRA